MKGVTALARYWPVRRDRQGARPYREHSVTDALNALPAEPPLSAPTLTLKWPAPDRETRPIPELREGRLPVNAAAEPVTVATRDPAALRRAAGGLRGIDFDAVDAAKEVEGATHVSMRATRGRAPFGEYMDRCFIHPAWRHPLRGQVNLGRVQAVPYPEPGKVADATDYAAAMRRLDQITGTQGWTPRRAISAGGAG